MKRTISAVEARRRLGEILEGVFYRGDEVVIERAGKVMGVVVPPERYQTLERDRERFWEIVEKAQTAASRFAPEELDEMIASAIAEVRNESSPT